MNRLMQKSIEKILLNRQSFVQYQRYYSSQRSSSKLKISLIGGGALTAATTLTLIYANYDPKFRSQLVSYLPFINTLLSEDSKQNAAANAYEESLIKPKIQQQQSIKHEVKKVEKPSENVVPKDEKPSIVPSVVPTNVQTTKESNLLEEKEIKSEIAKTFEKAMAEENIQINSKGYGENELRIQLKRQLYVFQEYFKEQFILYKTELKRKLETDLKNKVLQEKAKIADDFEDSFTKLRQMESLLEVRDHLDKQEKATKGLWLISQTLTNLLEHDRSSLNEEPNPIQINETINCIRKMIQDHFENEALIKLALENMPENAVTNGVYSEEDLIRRFNKVEKICNQVSLIDNEYTTLFGYLKSFAYSYIRPLQQIEYELSMNPIHFKSISQDELEGKKVVDPKEWDTYDILQRVRLSIENRNLEMALRYANQLSGEPRKIASDWIRDTREHLEVKQAVRVVQSKIASINLHQMTFAQ
ncbi:hypothetical protein RDWZM_000873 [Blomia tropicalis]|uniref:MICOS complex subunit MIC60 n=1 Tax=Blomia tropicalis TaxID=40697 RepID=A0A9Q0MBR9_BLOTA|nr:hypothetical protein RDWZM_000873 [Blomia tropicalis]